jgi:radical SAM superfamily enzyme YgiQ (UPF0313 family)
MSKPIHIAFISPKGPLYRHKTGIFKKALRPAPLTFSTLASLVPPELDITMEVLDEGIEDLDPHKVQADLAAMTAITGSANRAYEIAAVLRERGIPVVIGGPHPTLAPEDSAPHVDSVVTGYAEETWPELLRDFARGEMKSRYDMDPEFTFQGYIERNGSLPLPRRDVMKKSGYRTLDTFEATRGCVHECDFCVVPHAWGRRPFLKPVDHIIADIKQRRARKVLFYDLNIIASRKHAIELFEALIPLKVKWYGLATALMGRDTELLELAARSGCKGLLVGFESVSPDSLADFSKRINDPKLYTDFIKDLQSLGIAINGTFAFGSDGDTKDSFNSVINFCNEQRIELPRFSILTPFPGTKLHERLDGEGRLLHKDWSLYDGQHVVYEPKNMSAGELWDGHRRVWEEIYSMKSVFHRIKGKKQSYAFMLAANMAYRYYANKLHKFYVCDGGLP